MPKTLILVTTRIKSKLRQDISAGISPRMDFFELADLLDADVLDYSAVLQESDTMVRLTNRLFGINVALAALAIRRSRRYDTILTGAERVGIPLAMLMRVTSGKAKHCMVCHLMTKNSKQVVFRSFGLGGFIDNFVCQNGYQTDFLKRTLSVAPGKVHYIRSVPVDQKFFSPIADAKDEGLVSVGKELRDYATLVEAATGLDIPVHIVASSPWSVRENHFGNKTLAKNISITSNHSYKELREIYAGARFVVLPLKDVESPAGVTSLLEAMSMGKATIVTASRGIVDFVDHMETGILVKPNDPKELRQAIIYLQNNPSVAAKIGSNARSKAEKDLNMDCYVSRTAEVVESLRNGTMRRRAFST